MWIDMKVVHLQAINLKTWMFCELYVADSPSEYVYTLKQEKKKKENCYNLNGTVFTRKLIPLFALLFFWTCPFFPISSYPYEIRKLSQSRNSLKNIWSINIFFFTFKSGQT